MGYERWGWKIGNSLIPSSPTGTQKYCTVHFPARFPKMIVGGRHTLMIVIFFRAVFKYDGSNVVVSAKGESFDEFKTQFGDDERAFAYIRLQVR